MRELSATTTCPAPFIDDGLGIYMVGDSSLEIVLPKCDEIERNSIPWQAHAGRRQRVDLELSEHLCQLTSSRPKRSCYRRGVRLLRERALMGLSIDD